MKALEYVKNTDIMTDAERTEAWRDMTLDEQREARIFRGLLDGEFIQNKAGVVVCSTCGGNCGQCGVTDTIGNVPFDFQTLIDNTVGKNAGRRPVTKLTLKEPPKRSWWSKALRFVGINTHA